MLDLFDDLMDQCLLVRSFTLRNRVQAFPAYSPCRCPANGKERDVRRKGIDGKKTFHGAGAKEGNGVIAAPDAMGREIRAVYDDLVDYEPRLSEQVRQLIPAPVAAE